MAYKKIVVTGGACAGKTTGMVRIREHLQNLGYRVAVVPEAATLIFDAAGRPNPSDRSATMRYQKAILSQQLRLEATLEELTATEAKSVILCDRGAHDSKAYMSPTEWSALLDDLSLNDYKLLNRYDAVIHLVTAADGAPHAYKLEGQRNETPEQARLQDKALQQAYLGHGHHKIIGNETSFDEKIRRAITEACHLLGEPEPLEVERKFLVEPPAKIPGECSSSRIEQIYLLPLGEEVRRVRKRTQQSASVYTLTSKVHLSAGVNIEKETPLTGEEYLQLVQTQRDPKRNTVEKIRHCFIHNRRVYELDEYIGRLAGLWILEAEVENLADELSFPPWLTLQREVTHAKDYSNHNLALIAAAGASLSDLSPSR